MKKRLLSTFMVFVFVCGFIGWLPERLDIIANAATSSDFSISDNGIAFICAREGFSSTCYSDGSQSSIGYGTKCTGSSDQPHDSGLHSITQEEAMEALKTQVNNTYAPRVRSQTSGITMNQNQFDALVSLCYNCGGGSSLISNSPLVRYLNGEFSESEARSQYSNYIVTYKGERSQGLVNRRNAEADLFFDKGSEMSSGAGQTIPDGDYIIVSELGMNLYLDIPGVKNLADPATYLTICDGDSLPGKTGMFDTWTVRYLNNGFYKISQYNTNICLDVENASCDRGAAVQTYVDNGTAAQQWSISETSHGYTLQAKCNSWYLDVKSSETATGTPVIMWEGTGNKNQSWCFIPVASDNRPIADGEYYIKSETGNVWLDASGDPAPKGSGYITGSNIQIWDSKTDIFNVKYADDGFYTLRESSTGLAVEVEDEDKDAFLIKSKNIQLGTYTGERRQLWKIVKDGSNNYRLVSKLSGYSLDLAGMKTDNGSNVQSHPYNTSNAQKWSFEKVIEKMLGDVNIDGKINVTDVSKTAAHVKGIKSIDVNAQESADVNGDGKINVTDVSKIAAHVKGIKPLN